MQRPETGVVEKGVWINVGVQTARLPFGEKKICSGEKNDYIWQKLNRVYKMTRSELIDKNKTLFWYTPESKKQEISDSLLIETIFNEGTLDDCRQLISTLGGKQVAKVFFSAKGRQKENYYPEIYHFFSLVLKKYA